MKINNLAQADAAYDAAKAYYTLRIDMATNAAGSTNALADRIGVNRTVIVNALGTRSLHKLRAVAHAVAEAGL